MVKPEIFEPGTVLEGKYKVKHVLGRGAMGVVYLAEDTYLARKAAIKVLSPQFQRDKELVGRFRREAVAMAAVHHPNLVQIYTFGVHDGFSYFVMEYLDGESLANVIQRRLDEEELTPLDEAVGIIVQVLKGLGALHSAGIVHRDVKPANILLSKDFRVALTDFGLVRPVEASLGKTLDLDGTPMYLAPERFRKMEVKEEHAHLCDIYSLGATLYELLTGSPPFETDNIVEVLEMHYRREPPKPSALRPELLKGIDRVVQKAMAKDPVHRYQTSEEMRRALIEARSLPEAGMEEVEERVRSFLLIDPDWESQEILHRTLKLSYPDASVLCCKDGEMGLSYMREARPQVAVVDQDAPRMNALELCSVLRDEPDVQPPVLIVLARSVDPLCERLFKEIGAAEVITKSHDPTLLMQVIKHHLQRIPRNGE